MKMKWLSFMLLSVSILTSPCAWAEVKPLRTEADAQRLCETFLTHLVANDVEGAFTAVEPHFPISPDELTTLKLQLVKQLGLLAPQFGKSLGQVQVKKQVFQDTVLQYTYLEKFEKRALRWVFVFYKSDAVWWLNILVFDDRVDKVVE